MSKISVLPPAGPTTGAETVVCVQDGETVRAPLGQLIEPYVLDAQAAADQAMQAAGIYPTITAGEAATVMGQYFKVIAGGIAETYVRNAVGSTMVVTEVTQAALGAAGGAGLVGTSEGTLAATLMSRVRHCATRAQIAALATAAFTVAILNGPVDRGLFVWDAGVTVAEHQARGRESLYVAPNPAADGAWRLHGGRITAESIGIRPGSAYATTNVNAWNAWRNRMQDMQTRQETQQLTLEFEPNQTYYFNDTLWIVQRHVTIAGAARLHFNGAAYGFRFEPQTLTPNPSGTYSINHLMYCELRDVTITGCAVTSVRTVNAPYFVLRNVTVTQSPGGPPVEMIGPISPWIENMRVAGGTRGCQVTSGIIDTVTGRTLVVPFNVQISSSYVAGASVGGYAIWEAQGVRLKNVVAEVNGGVAGRGFDFARSLNVQIDGVYTELHRYDIVFDNTKRVQQAYARSGAVVAGDRTVSVSTAGLWNGAPVSGPGIPANTVIASITDANTLELSADPTATNAAAALTLGYDAPYGNYSIDGAAIGGELLQPGNIVPTSLFVIDNHQKVRVAGGRFGGDFLWSGADPSGGTGFIDPAVDILGAVNSKPVGVIDFRGRFAPQPDIADLGAAPTAADFNTLLARLRAFGVFA